MFFIKIILSVVILPWAHGNGSDQFDVMSITNVPFPLSFGIVAATLNATQEQEISEFTVCYRFQITSYNDIWNFMFNAKKVGYYI